ncbi:MAG: hypothetical protein M3264_07400, partial [Thermoproteota archaeon]|nr:hypothetical protein [Thermoproteota archaeon]
LLRPFLYVIIISYTTLAGNNNSLSRYLIGKFKLFKISPQLQLKSMEQSNKKTPKGLKVLVSYISIQFLNV